MRPSLLHSLSIGAALALLAPLARGDDDLAWKQGQELFNQGTALVDAAKADGDLTKYDAARLKFLAAYAIVHRPNILFNLALAEKKLGRVPDALHHFRQFVRDPNAEAARVAQARTYIDELRPKAASVQLGAPAGADIYVDGVATGDKAPLTDPIDLDPGTHVVAAREGDSKVSRQLTVIAGTTADVTLVFPPARVPTPASPLPVAPPTTSSPPTRPPGADGAVSSRASAGRTITLVLVGGAALVAAGVGIGFTVASSNASNQQASYSSNPSFACAGIASPSCQGWHDAAQSKINDANTATGFYIAAGVLAVGFVGTLLLWPSRHAVTSAASVEILPSLGPGGGGASLVGRF